MAKKSESEKRAAAPSGRSRSSGSTKASSGGKSAESAESKEIGKAEPGAPSLWGFDWADDMFTNMRQEMDRVFERFTGRMSPQFRRDLLDREPFTRLERAVGLQVPEAEVVETDKDYKLTAELPGMSEADVTVEISGGMLKISGEKKDEHKEDAKGYHLSERRYGSFSRAFRIPDTVDADKIQASMKDGVLTLVMPKSSAAKSKARKIAVKSE